MKKVFWIILIIIGVFVIYQCGNYLVNYLNIKNVELSVLDDNGEYIVIDQDKYDIGKIKRYCALINKNKNYDVELAVIGKYKIIINEKETISFDIYENAQYASYNANIIRIPKDLIDYIKTIKID